MQPSAQQPRVRLNVESLESRELPSHTLTSFGRRTPYTTAQVRYVSPTSVYSGYSSGSSGIIGVLVAL